MKTRYNQVGLRMHKEIGNFREPPAKKSIWDFTATQTGIFSHRKIVEKPALNQEVGTRSWSNFKADSWVWGSFCPGPLVTLNGGPKILKGTVVKYTPKDVKQMFSFIFSKP